jgi:DNA polymerase III sliding clamp (beta) subunit (PCNA family)
MFTFSVNTKDFLKILNKSANITSKNPKMEIYSLVRIELSNKELILEAVGSSNYMVTSIPANFEDKCDPFLIKADLLIELLPLIKDEIVYLSYDLENGTLELKTSKTKQTIRTYNHFAKDFITPTKENDDIEVEFHILTKDFQKSMRIVNTSVGKPKAISDTKFTNICFSFPLDKKLTLVSTDKFRISKLNVDINHSKEISEARLYLLSPKSLALINSLIENQESILISFHASYAWIDISSTKLAIQYGGHDYPDINRIIPQSFSYIYTVNTEELKDALKQIGVIARKIEKSKAVMISVDGVGHVMRLESKAPDGSSLETDLPIFNYNGPEEVWQQSFNIDYLLEFINQIDDEKLVLEQQSGKVLISPEDKKDQILYLASGLKS